MANSRLEIYGEIGWDVTDNSFAEAFDSLLEGSPKAIDIYINSAGGSIIDGLAIFNRIRRASNEGTEINTIIDGVALSMGAIIALAGDNVSAYRNAMFMLHNASGAAYGDAKTMKEMAGVLEKFDNSLAESISEKTGKDLQYVLTNWMNYTDNWFSAIESKELGFVKNVISRDGTVPTDAKNLSLEDLNNYIAKQKGIFKNKHNTENNKKMDFFNKKKTEPTTENSFSAEDLTNAVSEALTAQLEDFKAQLTESMKPVVNRIEALETEVVETVDTKAIEDLEAIVAEQGELIKRLQGKATKEPHSETILNPNNEKSIEDKYKEIDNANKRNLKIRVA